MRGFIVRLVDGFIDNLLFSDPFYLSLSALSQNKLAFRRGDQVEFEANLIIDRGRFKFFKPGRFQFYQRGDEKPLLKADISVALKTYSIQNDQTEKCLHCESGLLVDLDQQPASPSRVMVCLQGVPDQQTCILSIPKAEACQG